MKTGVILQVLICTCGETGLEKVAAMTLPQAAGIGYLVSIQAKTMPPVPESIATREDLTLPCVSAAGLCIRLRHRPHSSVIQAYLQCITDVTRMTADVAGVLCITSWSAWQKRHFLRGGWRLMPGNI